MTSRLLRSYEFAHEAQLDLMKLHDEEIVAYLKNDMMVGITPHFSNAVGGVQLLVRDADFERAATLLSLERDSEDALMELFPEATSDPVPTCPKCQSRDVFQGRSFWSGILFYLVATLPISIRNNTMHCASCGKSWKTTEL